MYLIILEDNKVSNKANSDKSINWSIREWFKEREIEEWLGIRIKDDKEEVELMWEVKEKGNRQKE